MSAWEDGGPLEPPEYPEVDAEKFLRRRGCANCGGTVWRIVSTERTWTCATDTCDDRDAWTDHDIAQALDDEADAARDAAMERRMDALRDDE